MGTDWYTTNEDVVLARLRNIMLNIINHYNPGSQTLAKTRIKNLAQLEYLRNYNSDFDDNALVETAFNRLCDEGMITYTPYKPLEVNRMITPTQIEVGQKISVGRVHRDRKIIKVHIRNGQKEETYTSKEYCFYINKDINVFSGDLVVVDTTNGYQLAKVSYSEITDYDLTVVYKWVVTVVDIEEHTKRIEKERKIRETKKAMLNRLEEVEESLKLQRLAVMDPVLAKMYESLTELDSTAFPSLPDPNDAPVQTEKKPY